MKLQELLKKLPGVKPLVAKSTLDSWQNSLFNQLVANSDRDTSRMRVKIADGVKFSFDDLENIFTQSDLAPLVTPYGAGLVVELYRKGLLPMKQAAPGEVPTEVLVYASSGEKVDDVRKRLCEEQAAKDIAYREILSRPADIAPSSFTYSLLNDVFIYHHGLRGGATTMEIGGTAVTKTVFSYSSNSGKNRDSEVTFTWIGEDEVPQEMTKASSYVGNRRNDADRNWGLPE